jgi:hypothetical protein
MMMNIRSDVRNINAEKNGIILIIANMPPSCEISSWLKPDIIALEDAFSGPISE